MAVPSLPSSVPVVDWLLDSDPAIRWQVLRDLTDTPAGTVAAERSRVAAEGWGRRLLDQQRPDGQWGDGVATPFWWSNLYTLLFLRDLGVDPQSARVRAAIDRVPRRGFDALDQISALRAVQRTNRDLYSA
ncbi:MAG TPA: hypothetical protein VK849_11190, partial [Longimicrobiales bacterium]|nr:hypothetical protein [Longimicrobiales bacterium]